MKKFRWLAALLMVLMCATFMGCPPLPPELESYTVEFDSDGGSSVYDQTVNSGTTATEPKDPVKEGYTFEGWYLGDNLYDFSIPVTQDLTLKAKWKEIPKEDEEDVNKTDSEEDKKTDSEEDKKTDDNTSKDGETTNPETPTDPSSPTEDKTPVIKYTVSFNTDGGSLINNIIVDSGNTVSAPTDPIKANYAFDGWYVENVKFDFNSKIESNIILTAHWKEILIDTDKKVETKDDGTIVETTTAKTESGKEITEIVEKAPDGSEVTTRKEVSGDGSTKETVKEVDSSGNVTTTTKYVNADGTSSTVTEKADGSKETTNQFINGVVVETTVDKNGNTIADAKDKNGQTIELEEFNLQYIEYSTGQDYQFSINLADYLPSSTDFIKGDKITVDFTGVAISDMSLLQLKLASKAEIDNWYTFLGTKNGKDEAPVNVFYACSAGDSISFNETINIETQAHTRNKNDICLVAVAQLSANESRTNHRSEVVFKGNLKLTHDTTNRISKVDVTYNAPSEVTLSKTSESAYPGQVLENEVTVSKAFTGAWKDSSGNDVKYVPETSSTLTLDVSKTKELTPTWLNNNSFTYEFLKKYEDASILIKGSTLKGAWTGYGIDVFLRDGDIAPFNEYNFAAGAEYSGLNKWYYHKISDILALADLLTKGQPYEIVRYHIWCDNEDTFNKLYITYDTVTVPVHCDSGLFTIEAVRGYPVPDNVAGDTVFYKNSSLTSPVTQNDIVSESLELYVPSSVTSAGGRLTVEQDFDNKALKVITRQKSTDNTSVWLNCDVTELTTGIKLRESSTLSPINGERLPCPTKTDEAVVLFPFIKKGQEYTFELRYQCENVDVREKVTVVSLIDGLNVSDYIKNKEDFNKVKIVGSNDSYNVTLTNDVRDFLVTDKIKQAYFIGKIAPGNIYAGRGAVLNYINKFIENGSPTNYNWSGYGWASYQEASTWDFSLQKLLNGYNFGNVLFDRDFYGISNNMLHYSTYDEFMQSPIWFPDAYISFKIDDVRYDYLYSLDTNMAVEYEHEYENFVYNPNGTGITDIKIISPEYKIDKTEDNGKLTFTVSNLMFVDRCEWKVGNRVLSTDQTYVYNESDFSMPNTNIEIVVNIFHGSITYTSRIILKRN